MIRRLTILFTLLSVAFAAPAIAQVNFHTTARVIIAPDPNGDERDNAVYLFDDAGALVGSYPQFGSARTDAWGYRDGATDSNNQVYFGWAGGIVRHDADGSNPTQIVTGGGPNGTWRALAFDPTGDGGAGSIWSGDFGDDIVEIDLTGNVLNTFTNGGQYSLYGMAFDDSDGNLFGHSTGGEVVKISTVDGTVIPGGGWGEGFNAAVPGNLGVVNGGLSGYSQLGGNLAALCQCDPEDQIGIYDVAASTGAANGTFTSVFGIGATGQTGNLGVAAVTVVPEPNSLVLLAMGALAFIRRRR